MSSVVAEIKDKRCMHVSCRVVDMTLPARRGWNGNPIYHRRRRKPSVNLTECEHKMCVYRVELQYCVQTKVKRFSFGRKSKKFKLLQFQLARFFTLDLRCQKICNLSDYLFKSMYTKGTSYSRTILLQNYFYDLCDSSN